jgi:hypothetical protein
MIELARENKDTGSMGVQGFTVVDNDVSWRSRSVRAGMK